MRMFINIDNFSFSLLTYKFIDLAYHRNGAFNNYIPFGVCSSKCNKWVKDGLELAFSHPWSPFSLASNKRRSFLLVLLCCFILVHITWLDLGVLLSGKLMVKDLIYYRRKTCEKCSSSHLLLSSLWNSEGCPCRHFPDIFTFTIGLCSCHLTILQTLVLK